jgi:hypothetical protein
MSLSGRLLQRWEDRAAVRAEHELEPTFRRRIDRVPRRLADRRRLRMERRARPRDGRAIDDALERAMGRGQPPGF